MERGIHQDYMYVVVHSSRLLKYSSTQNVQFYGQMYATIKSINYPAASKAQQILSLRL